MNKIKSLTLRGFKSIKMIDPPLELGSINVFIGANGSGKSNLMSFFGMLNAITNQSLQNFISLRGGPETFLHFGSKKTPQMEARLKFTTDNQDNVYQFSLSHARGLSEKLVFTEERLETHPGETSKNSSPLFLGAGHEETGLLADPWIAQPMVKAFKVALRGFRFHQFHDTSHLSPLRNSRARRWSHTPFHSDGGNLPAVLFKLFMEHDKIYQFLLKTIRLMAPFFREFTFELVNSNGQEEDIVISWISEDSDYRLGIHQLSDGTLRFIALATLLLLPEEMRPSGAILIDEPELRLHPRALPVLAGLMRNASERTQILCSTQSADFLSEFDPQDVIVTNYQHGESTFTRLDPKKLQTWLEDEFSLGEIWKSNLIGGRPQHD